MVTAEQIERDAIVTARLAKNKHLSLRHAQQARPKNTDDAYQRMQKDWYRYCDEHLNRQYHVTEDRIVDYLHEDVLKRVPKRPGKSSYASRADALPQEEPPCVATIDSLLALSGRAPPRERRLSDSEPNLDPELLSLSVQDDGTLDTKRKTATLSASTVGVVVAGLIDLWAYQKSTGVLPETAPHPRGRVLSGLLDSWERTERKRKRDVFEDRGKYNPLGSYTDKHILRLVHETWVYVADKGDNARNAILAPMRTLLDFLLAHNMVLRSENRRDAEMADLRVSILPGEGTQRCKAMVLVMNHGKKQQKGQVEMMAVMRHKDYRLCTMGCMAHYLFTRWDVLGLDRPDFSDPSKWYMSPLLVNTRKAKGVAPDGHDPKVQYPTQLDWCKKMFSRALILADMVTHLPLAGGAQSAERKGVTDAQTRRAGRWAHDAMVQHYLASLPFEFIRTMAGFTNKGSYFLARNTLIPEDELQQKVWPWLDEWQRWFGDSSDLNSDEMEEEEFWTDPHVAQCTQTMLHEPFKHISPPDVPMDQRKDRAAMWFLRLLRELRIVFLQDSVLRRREFPGHHIWRHELFKDPLYASFASRLTASMAEAKPPEESRIEQVMPDVGVKLDTLTHSVNNHNLQLNHAISNLSTSINVRFQTLLSRGLMGRLYFE